MPEGRRQLSSTAPPPSPVRRWSWLRWVLLLAVASVAGLGLVRLILPPAAPDSPPSPVVVVPVASPAPSAVPVASPAPPPGASSTAVASAASSGALPSGPDTLAVVLDVVPGATLGELLGGWGLPVGAIREAGLPHHDLASIRPDRELELVWEDGAAEPVAVRYALDEDRTLVVARDGGEWRAELDEVVYDVEIGTLVVSVERSLWQDGLDAGLRPADLVRLARVFEYEIDFNSELREGARFSLVADLLSAPERADKLGTIHAVRVDNAGVERTAVRFEVDGEPDWFHPDGTGTRRAFLRSPLEFSRVTSGFNPRRFHPVLKERRPHNGTDFGAPIGTPVRSVAAGVVTYAGWNGGHGKFVKVDHAGPYQTSYSHLSRVRVRRGQRVRQGEVVGDVGTTGLSTGPHCHYQMWKNGRFVDPMRIELPSTEPVPDALRQQFEAQVAEWVPRLER